MFSSVIYCSKFVFVSRFQDFKILIRIRTPNRGIDPTFVGGVNLLFFLEIRD